MRRMQMKYLYVLVNAETGFYTEQTYVSMLSLRHVSPNAYITLIVDDETEKNKRNPFFDSIKQLTNEYKVIPLDKDMPPVARSRFLKTSMRQYVEEDFLYIDSDTIWASPVDETDFTSDIMGVLDGNCLLENNPIRDYIQILFKKTNLYPKLNCFFNGGVIYSKDTPFSHNFFKQWHNKWKESSKSGCFVDQPALNCVIEEICSPEKMQLPGEYNAQIGYSWDHFFNAKIIHYFSSSFESTFNFNEPYILKNKEFWQKFSNDGISAKVQQIINNPRVAFRKGFSIKDAEEEKLLKSPLYGFIKDLYGKKINGKKSRFDFLEKTIVLISKFLNAIHSRN